MHGCNRQSLNIISHCVQSVLQQAGNRSCTTTSARLSEVLHNSATTTQLNKSAGCYESMHCIVSHCWSPAGCTQLSRTSPFATHGISWAAPHHGHHGQCLSQTSLVRLAQTDAPEHSQCDTYAVYPVIPFNHGVESSSSKPRTAVGCKDPQHTSHMWQCRNHSSKCCITMALPQGSHLC